eukprot:755152-Hanusia_phi.AAC.1
MLTDSGSPFLRNPPLVTNTLAHTSSFCTDNHHHPSLPEILDSPWVSILFPLSAQSSFDLEDWATFYFSGIILKLLFSFCHRFRKPCHRAIAGEHLSTALITSQFLFVPVLVCTSLVSHFWKHPFMVYNSNDLPTPKNQFDLFFGSSPCSAPVSNSQNLVTDFGRFAEFYCHGSTSKYSRSHARKYDDGLHSYIQNEMCRDVS